MLSTEYACLVVNVSRVCDLPGPEACHVADQLIYHQRRLRMVGDDKGLDKIILKVRNITGLVWNIGTDGMLAGPFKVPI